MKLAQALLLRSEQQKLIENLKERIRANLKVQEGDQPNEDPMALWDELFTAYDTLCTLIQKINAANNTATLPDGRTLSQALVDRDILLQKRNSLSSFAEVANTQDYRLTRTEIKMNVTIAVTDLQREIDRLSKEFRELDSQIQEANWTVELL